MAGSNEITIEARLGTSKLESDARRGASVINQIFGSGQAQAGARPATAASATAPIGGGSLADEIAKQQSKAKVQRYTSGMSGGYGALGVSGGEMNASGTRAFQINKAVIHIQNAKIHAGRRGGGGGGYGPQSSVGPEHIPSTVTSTDPSVGGETGNHIRQTKLAEFGGGFRRGAMLGESLGGGTSIPHLFNLGMDATGMAFQKYQAHKAASQASAPGVSQPPEDHAVKEIAAQNREGGSRLVQTATAAGPIAGAILGAIATGAQRLGEAYISKITSQLPTIGQVGDMSAGGAGGIGRLGYSASAKGQMAMQAQMHMTSSGFRESGGLYANKYEASGGFGKAATFGHAQGLGAGQGMIMAAKIQEMNEMAAHGGGRGGYNRAQNDLLRIGGYGYGFGQRRMGQFAQMAIGIGEQQSTMGGGGDPIAIAQAMSRLQGHTTLAGAHHTASNLSGMMSAGSGSGSAISGLLMMAEAQRGGDWKSVMKAADKGITKGGMADLKSMLPKDMLEMVMYAESGGNMTKAEHLAEAVHGKEKMTTIGSDASMGLSMGAEGDPRLSAANQFAFQMEQLGAGAARFGNIVHRLNAGLTSMASGVDKLLKTLGI